MAKAKSTSEAASLPASSDAYERKWKVEEALRTLQRAGEIVHDKKLMAEVKAMAKDKSAEMDAVAKQADALAKMGRISPKQMAKLGAR